MSASASSVKKSSIGLVALACLLTALGLFLFAPERAGMQGAFMRVGLVMAALWLAFPAAGESFASVKSLPILVGAVAVVAARGKALLVILPILAVIGLLVVVLRPRPKRRRRSLD